MDVREALTKLGEVGKRIAHPFQRTVLDALQAKPVGTVYAGTANRKAIAKRRARNKMARSTRQAQRRAQH